MGRKKDPKLRKTCRESKTDTSSSDTLLDVSTTSEDNKKQRTLTDTADVTNTKQPKEPPVFPIFGVTKFYTDEFDAFEKYYDKINSCKDENSAFNLLSLADQLPLVEFCELNDSVTKFPNKDEQNEEVPDLAQTNGSIEFAHPCLKLVETTKKGRHLITTTKLEKGEVIINEKASVLIVNPLCTCREGKNNMYRCHHCAYAVHKFYTCYKCNIVVYCSQNCLLQSYNEYHRYECEALQRHYWKLEDIENSYTAFRMMIYGAQYNFNHEIPEDQQWGNRENNYPYIYRLQSHFNKLPIEKVYEILKDSAKTVMYLLARTNFFRDFICYDQQRLVKYVGGLLVKHYCQARINCVLLKYPNLDVGFAFNVIGSTGKAICPTVALLNHACSPNAVIILRNDRVLIKTLKPIQTNTEITIAYQEINTFFPLEDRQLMMKKWFYFESLCQCTHCTYETTWQEFPYKCQKCKKGKAKKVIVGGKEKLFCKDCNTRSDFDVKAEKTAEIADRATLAIEPILRISESYDKIFPSDSWLLLDVYRILYDTYEALKEKPLETIKYGLMYFNILDQYLPRLYPPCLEARMMFYQTVAKSKNFTLLSEVTADEFETIQYFMEDCLKAKKDILFYVPNRYLEFYIMEFINTLEAVQFNLKIIKSK